MKELSAWILWLIFGIFVVIMGFEGSLGKVLACIVAPEIVIVNSDSITTG
jgi:uncharacterized membrane protein